jgi:hypothetical protein
MNRQIKYIHYICVYYKIGYLRDASDCKNIISPLLYKITQAADAPECDDEAE